MGEDSKNDVLLKRVQIVLAILVSVIGVIVGIYNFKKVSSSGDLPPGNIRFSVKSSAGQPIGLARVEIFSAQNALVGSSQSDTHGDYAQNDLDAGAYSVKVAAVGYEPQITAIQVAPKKTTDFQIVLQPLPNQAGTQIRSALEEVGAGWIRKIGKSSDDTTQQTASQ